MRLVGMRPVVVHGGGPQISALMARLGKTAEFRDGLRVTDAETVDIARMVLIGQVNPQLVTAINLHGNYAVGVSGEDAGLIRAAARDPELGLRRRRRGDQPRRSSRACWTTSSSRSSPRSAPTTGAGLQHQRRRRRRRHRRGARRREARLPHRHRGAAARRRRRRQPDPPDDGRRARRARRRRHDRRRHDPQGRRAASTPCATASDGPTSSTAASPTSCCSRSSPTPASARWSMGARPHDAHAFDATPASTTWPFMPVFGPPPVMFVRGRGHRAVGRRRQALPRLPVRARRHVARPRQPGRRRRRSRRRPTSCCTSATSSPTRWPSTRPIEVDPLLAEATGPTGRSSSPTPAPRPIECAHQAGPQARRSRPPRRRQRARQLPRAHAGGARGDRPADQARAVPADAGGLPPRRLGRPRRARPVRRRHRSAAVLIEPVQGEGGVNAGARRLPRRDPRAVRRRRAR